ncbi:A24 family peptidase [Massilia suwonensis]|uniref:Prepilin peptidase n=1 Tax=Massilia suwonensis TaxID=648895 RepID=A0ABW0MKW6_9BURK
MPISIWLDLLLTVLVVSAAVTDLAIRKIPNLFLLLAWCAVISLHLADTAPLPAIGTALGGALVGFALFLPLYVVRGMAAGDVKLMSTVGLFLGPAEAVQACIFTWCAGGIMALVMILFTRRWSDAYANLRSLLLPMVRIGPTVQAASLTRPSVGSMPYGLAIAVTTLWLLAQRYFPTISL